MSHLSSILFTSDVFGYSHFRNSTVIGQTAALLHKCIASTNQSAQPFHEHIAKEFDLKNMNFYRPNYVLVKYSVGSSVNHTLNFQWPCDVFGWGFHFSLTAYDRSRDEPVCRNKPGHCKKHTDPVP